MQPPFLPLRMRLRGANGSRKGLDLRLNAIRVGNVTISNVRSDRRRPSGAGSPHGDDDIRPARRLVACADRTELCAVRVAPPGRPAFTRNRQRVVGMGVPRCMDGRTPGISAAPSPLVVGTVAEVVEVNAATLSLTAAIVQTAVEPASIGERAQQILDDVYRVVPYEAASISVREPERQARYALAATGEVAALHDYSESRQGDAELDLIGLNRPTPPLRHTDLPMPAAETLCWPQYLWPAGFGGSLGVGLFTPDGRHVAHLTVLTEDASRPTAADRDLIGAVTRVMAHAVDRMRTIRAAARLVGDAVAGAVLTRGGNALPLPGLPAHPVLATGSPVLAEAAERLDAGHAYAVFLGPAPGAGATGELPRISVLDCGDEGRDHLRAVVLVSPAPDLRGLSHRELQILGYVVAGWPDDHIAAALEITAQDVVDSIHRSMYLLSVPSRAGLAVRALREGLLLPPGLVRTT